MVWIGPVKTRPGPTRCLPLDGSQAVKPPLALPSTERQANSEIASGGPPGGLGVRQRAARRRPAMGNSLGGGDMEVGAGIGRAPFWFWASVPAARTPPTTLCHDLNRVMAIVASWRTTFPPHLNDNNIIRFTRYSTTFRSPYAAASNDVPFRLNFPEFTPTNPRYWIRKCEQYFDVHDVEEHRKVKLARLHLNEEGDIWLSNELLHHNELTWPQFVNRLCDRFGVQDSETVIAEFNHLKQIDSVTDYIKRFEELQRHVLCAHVSLFDKYFISCFLGGLIDPLQPLVRAHAPLTIQEAMAKAKLHEAALKSLSKHQLRSSPSTPFPSGGLKTPWDPHPVKKDPTCYRCPLGDLEEDHPLPSPDEQLVELSMHAINGSTGRGTLKLRGHISQKPVLILLDTGSTATFLNSKLVDALNLDVLDGPDMTIALANDTRVGCSKTCPDLSWEMCGSHF
ncbi:hypothetical protein EJ110_NYTH14747 [Nymphaea thermarum]|nr:hypothetical protein EJ110_NYTH14747 [Nymphaea thermarum]